MPVQSVVGVYASMTQMEEAVRRLDRGRFPIRKVSVVTRDSEDEAHAQGTANDAGTDRSLAGGLLGLLLDAAFVWMPGFGALVVAGPLTAAVLGEIEGALVGAGGGLLGALVGWGVSRRHIRAYEEAVRGGRPLVIARGSAEEVNRAREILAITGAAEIHIHPGRCIGKHP